MWLFLGCHTLATCLSAQCYIQNSKNDSDSLWWQISPSFSVSLTFSHCLTDICSLPLLFHLLSSVLSLPPLVVYCLHKLCCVELQCRLEDSSVLTQQGPPFCQSPCFMGSDDSCTLDPRQKWIIDQSRKKINTFSFSFYLISCLWLLTSHIWVTLLLKRAHQFKAISCFFNVCCFITLTLTLVQIAKHCPGEERWSRVGKCLKPKREKDMSGNRTPKFNRIRIYTKGEKVA